MSSDPIGADNGPIELQDPNREKNNDADVFEIGLVLAGAVSAGAYTAGVIDYLLESLDNFEREQRTFRETNPNPRNWQFPGHRVKIRIVTGASAGGMCGAIMATHAGSQYPTINSDPGPQASGNPFFDPWVNMIDMTQLFGDEDLKNGKGTVPALLNSKRIREIGQSILQQSNRPDLPDYLEDPFRLFLTVTNLSGIPYSVPLEGGAHRMSVHKDHVRFAVGNRAGACDEIHLAPQPDPNTSWAYLPNVAIACGAFPLVLEAVELSTPPKTYDWRVSIERPLYSGMFEPRFPAWQDPAPDPFRFVAVDGGTMDNEPLELCRRVLAGAKGRNPREGNKALRATILVDPFTEPSGPPDQPSVGLSYVALSLVQSLLAQSRFKPEELKLAQEDETYSRFMITPMNPQTHRTGDLAIACGGLGGFTGFLQREYRLHDYFLGRRNCHDFLQSTFVLPKDNPLIKNHWNERLLENPGRFAPADRPDHRCIIPPAYEEPPRVVEWPQAVLDLDEVGQRIEDRFDKVWFKWLDESKASWLVQTYLGPFRRQAKKMLVDLADGALRASLKERNLRFRDRR